MTPEAQLVALATRSPLGLYVPTPKQQRFHESAHPRRRLQAANATGKTYAGAAEAWWHALGRHPYHPVAEPPTVGLVVTADYTGGYRDVVAPALAALAPWEELDPRSTWTASRGWRNDVIELRNGSKIVFRSSSPSSQTTSIAGVTASWVWSDEPPTEEQWGEVRGRLRGRWLPGRVPPMWMTFTPVGRDLTWLRLHMEGDPTRGIPPAEEWEEHRIRLSESDCPHLPPHVVAALLASWRADEYAQRALGEWEGPQIGRVFDGWSRDLISSEIPEADWLVGLGIDHGERAGAEAVVLILWHPTKPLIWVLDEWESTRATEPAEDARHVRDLLARHGLTVASVDMAVGDTNSAGKQAVGRRINDLLGAELGITIRPPRKVPGSVDYGTRLVNIALRRGHLHVHPRVKGLVHSLEHWLGKDDDLKHRIDAARYLLVPVLESRYQPAELDRLRVA